MPRPPDPVPLLLGNMLAGGYPPHLRDTQGRRFVGVPTGAPGRFALPQGLGDDFCLLIGRDLDTPVRMRRGGWDGEVSASLGGLICGRARDLRDPRADVVVIAVAGHQVVAQAVAKAAEDGRFLMILPPAVTGRRRRLGLAIGIAGSDHILAGGHLVFAPPDPGQVGIVHRDRLAGLSVRIKISAANLREATRDDDFHFASSMAAALERQGVRANVDTLDMWHAHAHDEDVVISIRGRHRLPVDPRKINIIWMISSVQQVTQGELAGFDHVFVASHIHGRRLAAQGLSNASVMHRATDLGLFRADDQYPRRPRGLFVGNSSGEYRTMVKWSIKAGQPLDLYGDGWDGIVPPQLLRGIHVSHEDQSRLYADHALLLVDHDERTREDGYLSNRLFDGSAVATPILTDPVAGLRRVFGDTIAVASDPESFRQAFVDCLSNPFEWREKAIRARAIVENAHTFDHRAFELAEKIRQIAARRRL